MTERAMKPKTDMNQDTRQSLGAAGGRELLYHIRNLQKEQECKLPETLYSILLFELARTGIAGHS